MRRSIDITRARAQAQLLEDAIVAASAEYGGAASEALRSMLTPTISSLRAIREQIDLAIGLAELTQTAEPLWVELVGGRVQGGSAPAALVAHTIEGIQSAVRRVTVASSDSPYEEDSAHSRLAGRRADLDIVCSSSPGTRFGFRSRDVQYRLGADSLVVDRALHGLVDAGRWAQENGTEEHLIGTGKNALHRRNLVRSINQLSPRPRNSYQALRFSGAFLGTTPFEITSDAYVHSKDYLAKKSIREFSVQGRLVLIDVERHIFHLRVGDQRLLCRLRQEDRQHALTLIDQEIAIEGGGHFQPLEAFPYRMDVTKIAPTNASRNQVRRAS